MSTSKYLKNVSDLLLSDKKIDMMELYYNLNMRKAKLKKENGLPCKMFLFMSDDDDYNNVISYLLSPYLKWRIMPNLYSSYKEHKDQTYNIILKEVLSVMNSLMVRKIKSTIKRTNLDLTPGTLTLLDKSKDSKFIVIEGSSIDIEKLKKYVSPYELYYEVFTKNFNRIYKLDMDKVMEKLLEELSLTKDIYKKVKKMKDIS